MTAKTPAWMKAKARATGGCAPAEWMRLRRPPPSRRRPLQGGLLSGLTLLGGLALGALQRTPGLGEEDVVQAGLMELEVGHLHVGLVEGADDVGKLLAAVIEPDGCAL